MESDLGECKVIQVSASADLLKCEMELEFEYGTRQVIRLCPEGLAFLIEALQSVAERLRGE